MSKKRKIFNHHQTNKNCNLNPKNIKMIKQYLPRENLDPETWRELLAKSFKEIQKRNLLTSFRFKKLDLIIRRVPQIGKRDVETQWENHLRQFLNGSQLQTYYQMRIYCSNWWEQSTMHGQQLQFSALYHPFLLVKCH